MIRLQVPV